MSFLKHLPAKSKFLAVNVSPRPMPPMLVRKKTKATMLVSLVSVSAMGESHDFSR
jgi:hypothetical protein